MQVRGPAKRPAPGCAISRKGAPGYIEVTLCYDGHAAPEIGAVAILTEVGANGKRKNKATSSIARSGPERCAKDLEWRDVECHKRKNKPTLSAELLGFAEAGGTPPPVAKRAIHLLPQKRVGEGTRSRRSAKAQKQTHFTHGNQGFPTIYRHHVDKLSPPQDRGTPGRSRKPWDPPPAAPAASSSAANTEAPARSLAVQAAGFPSSPDCRSPSPPA